MVTPKITRYPGYNQNVDWDQFDRLIGMASGAGAAESEITQATTLARRIMAENKIIPLGKEEAKKVPYPIRIKHGMKLYEVLGFDETNPDIFTKAPKSTGLSDVFGKKRRKLDRTSLKILAVFWSGEWVVDIEKLAETIRYKVHAVRSQITAQIRGHGYDIRPLGKQKYKLYKHLLPHLKPETDYQKRKRKRDEPFRNKKMVEVDKNQPNTFVKSAGVNSADFITLPSSR